MKKKVFGKLKEMLNKPSRSNLFMLSKAFQTAIPFNSPHKLSFKYINENEVHTEAKYIRKNKNHLGGIHACAMATIGELAAGTLIIQKFGMIDYRIIMSKIEATYHYQAKTDIVSKAKFTPEELTRMDADIKKDGVSLVELSSELYDTQDNHVATVTTCWQLKEWTKVKTNVT
ncbi:MAG: acyl-coenzyme A thioesterase PaaI-like protein [Thermoproteota archaeon]|jgi:acyl-coenzyme A thioesterase PaaI-like protein